MNMIANLKNTVKKNDAETVFGAFVCDDDVTKTLLPVINERDWDPGQIKSGGIENAIRTLGAVPCPQYLIVDVSNSADPLDDVNALAEVCEPGTMVIAIGTANDVDLYRELLASGVQEYLLKPVSEDALRTALLDAEHALRLPLDSEGEKSDSVEQKLVAVVGMRGGVGTSTIASSLSWLLANDKDHKTALLDLDIYFGTDALTFDMEPGRGLVDALENPSRVDGLFLERAVLKESDNLSILGAEAPLNDAAYTDPAALSHLLTELKGNFTYVIMDLPRNMAADYPLLLSEADQILVVADLTLPATRDTIRFLSYAKEISPGADVRVIINRTNGPGLVEVDQKDFEASIERKVNWLIPSDYKTMVAASRMGKPLPQAAKGSKLVTAIRQMADDIVGEDFAPTKKPFWKSFSLQK
tara:strand:- start:2880 stop:4121 length:1242 start_codon:yes stop_codon:yes gene_type:complete